MPARIVSITRLPYPEVRLADGNRASVGDVIITRRNDRRLRLTATDWVKNGDRWTITAVGNNGDLTVRHNRSRLTVRLPADYVQDSTGLGYATTIHAAQGVSADTMHGLLTGQESRQQLYTMLTRGRAANHLYLQVVGDGDPHTLIRPESRRTPHADRDPATDPRPRRHPHLSHHAAARTQRPGCPAVRRRPALHRRPSCRRPSSSSDPRSFRCSTPEPTRSCPDLTNEPSWPTLRAHLLTLAAETGEHPLLHLQTAAAGRELHTAGDMAAVLDWRLPEPAPTDPGPLPWLPGIPKRSMIIPFGANIWRSGPN